jgi:pyridoxamine 5'-phosphate oxidase
VLPDRAELERRYSEYEQKYDGVPVPRPPYWSGVLLKPTVIEFWEGMPNRLHIRHQYLHGDEGWTVRGLYP